MKQQLTELAQSAKGGWLALAATQISNWWVDYGSPLIDASASIGGLVLIIVLIRYHWKNGNKLDD